jgi:hypothetical protein
VIGSSQVIDELVASCLGIEDAWAEHLAWWGEDERGHFNDIAVVARYMVDSVSRGQTEAFDQIFAKVEGWLINGDEEVRNLLIVGLLEDLQNVGSWSTHGYKVFEPWLGRETERAWRWLEQVWEGKDSLMGVIRAERKQPKQ